jgi:polysaccharide biosynthesis/export protein
MLLRSLPLICFIFARFVVLQAQTVLPVAAPDRVSSDALPTTSGSTKDASTPPNYVLGANDKLVITVREVEEIRQAEAQTDLRGDIRLPLLGVIHVSGLTVDQVASEIRERARKYVKDPEVLIAISDYQSQPVAVLGSVNSPGVSQLHGNKSLFEVLSTAGGLRTDAGDSIQITRRIEWGRIPLPGARDDVSGKFSVASVKVKGILQATDPAENIILKPGDVVSVPKADLVYCVGAVKRPGGFPLGQSESLSTLQVLSLAEGLDKNAAPDKARILRAVAGKTTRDEIPVNLKRLTAGQIIDLPLKSDDILFIPNSLAKSASSRTLEAIIQAATGVAIYGRY